MAYPPDPAPPERSIYERLGIDADARKLRRVPNRPGTKPSRPAGRSYVVGLFAILLVAGLVWAFANNGGGGPSYRSAMPDEDQRRMEIQAAQISALTQRVEMLEIRVRALQELAGYQLPPVDDANAKITAKSPAAGKKDKAGTH